MTQKDFGTIKKLMSLRAFASLYAGKTHSKAEQYNTINERYNFEVLNMFLCALDIFSDLLFIVCFAR